MRTRIIGIIVLIAVLALTLSLTSCGNMNMGFGSYTYTHAHISDGTEGHCVSVSSWHDNELGCEIHTDSGTIYCSEGTYHLFTNAAACPFC